MHSVQMTIHHLFSREAKIKCWKIIGKFPKILTCFETLITCQKQNGDLFTYIEEFVYFVHGAKVKSIKQCKMEEI